jgi:hypothetical protein
VQITRRQLYRPTTIARVPNLQTLDGVRINDEERQQADESVNLAVDGAPSEAPAPALFGGPVNKVSLKVNTMQLEFLGPAAGPLQPVSGGRLQESARLFDTMKGFETLKPSDPHAPRPSESSARGKRDLRRTSSLPVRKVEMGLETGSGLSRGSADDFARLLAGRDERGNVRPGLAKRADPSPVRRASDFPGRMLVVRPLSRDRTRPPRMSTGTPGRDLQSKKDAGAKPFPNGLSLKDYYTR